MKYAYPAVLTKIVEDDFEGYSVNFPDLDGCITEGDSIEDALEMAEDALNLVLVEYEDTNKEIPIPTSIDNLNIPNGAISSYVRADTDKYREVLKELNKTIKKTVSVPKWLNDEAEKKNVNFSKILKEGLMEALGY